MLHFTFPVMQAKIYLAAMHTNTNAGGELRWKIARPRANKGQPTAKPVKETITRCYLNELFEEVVTLRLAYEKALRAQRDYHGTVPETLSATAGPVDKANVVARQRRRLNWRPTID
ncbi:hypothetical protein V1264_017390 [Littorina saxatilis]|uniref:Uncharacterized protein n=1 Tax=Littorina saxatilis TaxID=31220 RepID=A0AAN9BJ05_9CAEN